MRCSICRPSPAWLVVALLLVPWLGIVRSEAAEEPPAKESILTEGPLSKAQEDLVIEFSRLWQTRAEGLFANRFLGIPTLQNPLDVWVTQEIFYQVKPDFVVEAGTFRGGSALLWASLLQQINPEARVITIDIEDKRVRKAREHPLAKQKVEFLLGSSTSPEIVREVTRRVKGKPVVVILDSLHTAEHVRQELELYAPLVPVGSYIIVQDTPAGPIDAIHEFLSEHDDFEADRSRERLLLTNNAGGFLKRVK